MEHVKLIACDIDGTLLRGGARSLRPETCGLIRRLGERGVLFFAASGRQHANLQRLFSPIRDEIGYICENGCLTYWKGEMLHREVMDEALGREIIADILRTEGVEVLVSGESVSYIQPKDSSFLSHMRDYVGNNVAVVPDILRCREPYMKISLFERDGLRDAGLWQAKYSSRCEVAVSGAQWLDLVPKGVSKGAALKLVLGGLGIAPEDCMAIGDNENDVDMLRLSGRSVAVSGAHPLARAAAKTETELVEGLFEELLCFTAGNA